MAGENKQDTLNLDLPVQEISAPPALSRDVLNAPNLEFYWSLRDLVCSYLPAEKIHYIDKAFELADRAHDGQKRASGEPYITHPLAVLRNRLSFCRNRTYFCTAWGSDGNAV